MKLPPVLLPARSEPWGTLAARMSTCQRCSLARDRRQVVIYRGPPSPWLLFVGEAPGRSEDEQGLPFVGRAGKILDGAAASAGLAGWEWGVTNVVMCRPPQNRFDRNAAMACRPWLGEKIAALAPRVLVTLGANALEAFLPGELPVSEAAGRAHTWEGRVLFPMLHPAATLHSKAFAERWRSDWTRFGSLVPGWRDAPGRAREQTPIFPTGSLERGEVRALPSRGVLPPPP